MDADRLRATEDTAKVLGTRRAALARDIVGDVDGVGERAERDPETLLRLLM